MASVPFIKSTSYSPNLNTLEPQVFSYLLDILSCCPMGASSSRAPNRTIPTSLLSSLPRSASPHRQPGYVGLEPEMFKFSFCLHSCMQVLPSPVNSTERVRGAEPTRQGACLWPLQSWVGACLLLRGRRSDYLFLSFSYFFLLPHSWREMPSWALCFCRISNKDWDSPRGRFI